MAPRETEDNAYAKFWLDKQRALWYVMVFWSGQLCLIMFWRILSNKVESSFDMAAFMMGFFSTWVI